MKLSHKKIRIEKNFLKCYKNKINYELLTMDVDYQLTKNIHKIEYNESVLRANKILNWEI